MEYTELRFNNAENTSIKGKTSDGLTVFIGVDNNRIYNEIIANNIEVLPFIDIKPDIQLDIIRIKRNELLQDTDKYFLIDFPLPSGITIEDIKTYRTSLRQIPETINLTGIKTLGVAMAQFPIKPF